MQLEPLASPALRNGRDIIDRQVSHLTRLVDDLLDVGRFNTGKVKLRKEPRADGRTGGAQRRDRAAR